MALFTPGNQFWKLRSKHGRDKLFASPELLWDAACEYFEATDQRKWTTKDWVGKDAKPVDREVETPYTISGLCLYLNCHRAYFSLFKKDCSPDFLDIITRIEDIIYTHKFEGATVGVFNSTIVSRDLGLADKQEQKVDSVITGKVGITVVSSGVPLANSEEEVNAGR